jgi:Pyruvate/2-oxoacid:ferredoxin oxidoreductase delta subunit
MNNDRDKHKIARSVLIVEPKCNGCVVCMKACPTRAIRIKDGRAYIIGQLCVDCGECIRVCPREAVEPVVSTYRDLADFECTVVFPSPSLYSQFGDEVLPNDVLLALTKLGFDYVYDIGPFCEMVSLAELEWLKNNPTPRPMISNTCPVVVRLITKRFPGLIPLLIPIEPPREVAARYIRRLVRAKTGLPDEAIGVFQITPCASKIQSINNPLALSQSYLTGALGIADLYGDIYMALKELTPADQDQMLFRSSGLGLSWDTAGGEVMGLRNLEGALAVNGLAETIEVLGDIESGRLVDVNFVECRTCPDGCLGGCLTVVNHYRARATVMNFVQMFGTRPRVRPAEVQQLWREGFFSFQKEIPPTPTALGRTPLEALRTLQEAQRLQRLLPGKLCGACGAPDCQTLAEDVVLGRAQLSHCPFIAVKDREVRG